MMLVASKYTMPEWEILNVRKVAATKREVPKEDPLRRPTTQHLNIGNFSEEEALSARAIPTRTRQNDISQINAIERSKEYMERWTEKVMNTTYRHDYCHTGYGRTIHNETLDQTVLVYSKGVLTNEVAEKAKEFIDVDPAWTRAFREMCRSLADSIDATDYRYNFTELRKVNDERFTHPRWVDPVPVSKGMKKPAEAYWETTYDGTYKKSERPDETFKAANLHRANYACPFDRHPSVDKQSTTFRDDFVDHVAHKDDQPLYWEDMTVRCPPGSGVVGTVVGDGNIAVF